MAIKAQFDYHFMPNEASHGRPITAFAKAWLSRLTDQAEEMRGPMVTNCRHSCSFLLQTREAAYPSHASVFFCITNCSHHFLLATHSIADQSKPSYHYSKGLHRRTCCLPRQAPIQTLPAASNPSLAPSHITIAPC